MSNEFGGKGRPLKYWLLRCRRTNSVFHPDICTLITIDVVGMIDLNNGRDLVALAKNDIGFGGGLVRRPPS